jgi:hypothetical protein
VATTPAAAPDVLHVEMLGFQGAGKTTLASAVTAASDWCSIAQLEERARLRPRRRPRHRLAQRVLPERLLLRLFTDARPDAKDAGTYAARHRSHLDAVMRGADLIADAEDRELAVQLLFESWAELGFTARFGRSGDKVLHHESVLQRAAHLLAHLPNPSTAVEEIVASLPLPHGVVLLRLPLATAIGRVHARADGFTTTEVMPSMERSIDAIVARLRSEDVPLVVVDAERPTATALPEVLAFVEQLPAATR